MSSEDYLLFIETELFRASARELPITDSELREVQHTLLQDPKSGPVIPGTGGVRKLRLAVKGTGKSGGARVIYYHVQKRRVIYLLLAYAKSEADNLTSAGKKLMRNLTKELDEE